MVNHQEILWKLGCRTLRRWRQVDPAAAADHLPWVMGILNVTPDSFSGGGQRLSVSQAVDAAMQMEADGADIIDIGGESTRPYSDPVSGQEELDRVMPVIEQLAGRLSIPISIDTSKAAVARAAVHAGAEIINDVTGLRGDAEMPRVAAECQAGICLMHMRGTPKTMQDQTQYDDVVAEVYQVLQQRLSECVAGGIARERICLDPGIGFAKTHEQNLQLLRATGRFTLLGRPLLIGHSRKGFIGKLLGDDLADRDAGSLGVSLAVAAAGADLVRVHAVRPTVAALRLFAAAGGLSCGPR